MMKVQTVLVVLATSYLYNVAMGNSNSSSTTTTPPDNSSTTTSPWTRRSTDNSSTTMNSSAVPGTSTPDPTISYSTDQPLIDLDGVGWHETIEVVMIVGVGVVVALFIFVLIPVVSISLDRLYCRERHQKTYTVNRMDRIGVDLQEATSATPDVPEETTLMLRESELESAVCKPVSASFHVEERVETHRQHEEPKMEPVGESLESVIERLTNMTEKDFAWHAPDLEEDQPRAESSQARSQSDPSSSDSVACLYAKPDKVKKSEASGDGSRAAAVSGEPSSEESVLKTKKIQRYQPGKRSETDEGDGKNASYLHSPSASADMAAVKTGGGDRDKAASATPRKSFPHIYEDLKDIGARQVSPDTRTSSVSGGNVPNSAVAEPGCKITIPHYFELHDLNLQSPAIYPDFPSPPPAPETALAQLGDIWKPGPYKIDPLASEYVSSSGTEAPAASKGELSPVKLRQGTGLMAGLMQHRLSDGALDQISPIAVMPQLQYSSLQRPNTKQDKGRSNLTAYYSKLQRSQPMTSANVYNKLNTDTGGPPGNSNYAIETSL